MQSLKLDQYRHIPQVESIECQLFLRNKTLIDLSAQDLVDCAKGEEYHNKGCNGGLMDYVYEYVIDHGIQTEKSYPYTGIDGRCKHNDNNVVKLKSYVDLKNEEEVAQAVSALGPVSTAIDASALQFYSHGILDENSECGDQEDDLNHGVLIVGYGTDYYIVKNSWGEQWGEQGYFRIKRNVNACVISFINSYPVL